MGVEERACCAFADGEIHILRQLAGQTCQLERVQPADYDANDMARLIKDWPTTVSRLDRCRDLDQAAVVSRAGERADSARRDVRFGGQEAPQRVADHDDVIPGPNSAPFAELSSSIDRRTLE